MISFTEWLKIKEELWMTSGPQDNPSNPGTKRKNAKDLYNHRYDGTSAPTSVPIQQAPPGKKMKK